MNPIIKSAMNKAAGKKPASAAKTATPRQVIGARNTPGGRAVLAKKKR